MASDIILPGLAGGARGAASIATLRLVQELRDQAAREAFEREQQALIAREGREDVRSQREMSDQLRTTLASLGVDVPGGSSTDDLLELIASTARSQAGETSIAEMMKMKLARDKARGTSALNEARIEELQSRAAKNRRGPTPKPQKPPKLHKVTRPDGSVVFVEEKPGDTGEDTAPPGGRERPEPGLLTGTQKGSIANKRAMSHASSKLQEKINAELKAKAIEDAQGFFTDEAEATEGFSFTDIATQMGADENNAHKDAGREFWFAIHPEWRAEYDSDFIEGFQIWGQKLGDLEGATDAAIAKSEEDEVVLPRASQFFPQE